jgi:tetraprenyl-beta-curcumene synthase
MTAPVLPPSRPGPRDAVALPSMLLRYSATVLPRARRELRRWDRLAHAIPDPALRVHACATLRDEDGNAEGAALLALAAPPPLRAEVTRLLVAFQVMYDYLDTLSEQATADPLEASRRLHRALFDVLGNATVAPDWYAGYAHGDDGGYLAALVTTCGELFATLPSRAIVAPAVQRAMERAGESQSRNHAAMLDASELEAFAAWAAAQSAPACAMHWWELAAACGSSLAIHALLAAAADPALTPATAAQIERAYWPWICGLNTLLESVVDAGTDALTGNHSYVGRYQSPDAAVERLAQIAAHATAATRALPNASHHATVLAAMACFYLSAPRPGSAGSDAGRRRVLAQLDVDTRLPDRLLRLRRHLRDSLERRLTTAANR